MGCENPIAPAKRGCSKRSEMNRFNPFFNIDFRLTHLYCVVNKKNKEFKKST